MTTTPNKPEPGAQDEMLAAFNEWFGENSLPETPANLALGYWAQEAFKAGAQWQASRTPVVHPLELTSRVNAALGNVFSDDPVSACRAQDAIKPLLPSLVAPVVQAVPEGWRLVPEFATKEMIDALYHHGYAEMLESAPSAPQAVAAPNRDAALEEAALEAEHWQAINTTHQCGAYIAAAIRGLKQAPQPIAAPACFMCHGTGKHAMASAIDPGQGEQPTAIIECQQCKPIAAPVDHGDLSDIENPTIHAFPDDPHAEGRHTISGTLPRQHTICGPSLNTGNFEPKEWAATEKEELLSVLAEYPVDPDHEFKNFHRNLCVRFNYAHDAKDWKRDQVSLIEHIVSEIAKQTKAAKDANSDADMYANAWQRELAAYDGTIRNKRHHIDAMVLTTQGLVAKLRSAEAAAQLVQQRATLSDDEMWTHALKHCADVGGDYIDFSKLGFAKCVRAILAAAGVA